MSNGVNKKILTAIVALTMLLTSILTISIVYAVLSAPNKAMITAEVLDVDLTTNALITKAVPDADSGAYLIEDDYPDFFETETEIVFNGQVNIILGENPVYVEEF